jgi:hypothetical protein
MKIKSCKIFKILAIALCFFMVFEQSGFAQVAGQMDISGRLVAFSNSFSQDKFRPLHLRYLQYDSQLNNFNLLLDKGNLKTLSNSFVEESTKTLLQYFLVGVSLPNDAFWVNLRPDSPDDVIDPLLGQTEVGKILLEADVQLKKDTAKFTSPETPEGKEYWDKLYTKAGEIFGGQNVTIPTLTRPWIVPNEIIIRETTDNAYIYKATLKVMLEDDYLKGSAVYNFDDARLKELNTYASQILREKIIPKLTQEVNTSKKYASLRQVYYSLILAQWFKQRFNGKGGPYASLINRKNLAGLISKGSWSKNTYFKQYQKSFKDGEYNFRVPMTTPSGQVVRSYFSGGIQLPNNMVPAQGSTAMLESGGRSASIIGKLTNWVNRIRTVVGVNVDGAGNANVVLLPVEILSKEAIELELANPNIDSVRRAQLLARLYNLEHENSAPVLFQESRSTTENPVQKEDEMTLTDALAIRGAINQMPVDEALAKTAKAMMVIKNHPGLSDSERRVELQLFDFNLKGLQKDKELKNIAQRRGRRFFEVTGWLAEDFGDQGRGHVCAGDVLVKVVVDGNGKLDPKYNVDGRGIFVNPGPGQAARIRLQGQGGQAPLVFSDTELKERGININVRGGEGVIEQEIPLVALTPEAKLRAIDVMLNELDYQGREISSDVVRKIAKNLGVDESVVRNRIDPKTALAAAQSPQTLATNLIDPETGLNPTSGTDGTGLHNTIDMGNGIVIQVYMNNYLNTGPTITYKVVGQDGKVLKEITIAQNSSPAILAATLQEAKDFVSTIVQ